MRVATHGTVGMGAVVRPFLGLWLSFVNEKGRQEVSGEKRET